MSVASASSAPADLSSGGPAMPQPPRDLQALLQALLPVAVRAGEAIMEVYATAFTVETKDDRSPVTAADKKAEAVILAGLAEIAGDIAVVAEESASEGRIPDVSDGRPFFLVDPLDGTKEFIRRNGEFTVNIALIEGGRPVCGVVHAPALETTFWGAEPGSAKIRTRQGAHAISCRAIPEAGVTVLGSRSHGDDTAMAAFLEAEGLPVAGQIAAGSSLKFCRLAEGQADLYPRLGPTCEWDTGAGDAVLCAAGGSVSTLDGQPLPYGKGGTFLNPHFVARGWAV